MKPLTDRGKSTGFPGCQGKDTDGDADFSRRLVLTGGMRSTARSSRDAGAESPLLMLNRLEDAGRAEPVAAVC